MKTTHRLTFTDAGTHVVTLTNASGTIDIDADEFLRVADRLITGILEPGNAARRKSFDKLSALMTGLRHQGGRA